MFDFLTDLKDTTISRLPDRSDVDEAGERVRGAWRALKGEQLVMVTRKRSRAGMLGLIGIGAALAYFLDPERGRTRRAKTADQLGALVRTIGDRSVRVSRRVTSDVEGKVEKLRHRQTDWQAPDDKTLTDKVETELFGHPDVPKGSIVVNAEHGTVVLRGQVSEPAQIDELERLVRDIQGVEDVKNLLHLPGEPAPNKRAARRAGSS